MRCRRCSPIMSAANWALDADLSGYTHSGVDSHADGHVLRLCVFGID